MGYLPIVVPSPRFHLLHSILQRQEPVLVQTLSRQPGVEYLDDRAVSGLAGPAEVELHTVEIHPSRENTFEHEFFRRDEGIDCLHSKWLVLLAACLGNLVLTLDSGVIGVSYPALAEAFNTDTSTVLWVSVAFWVTGVGLVMTVGWLGDVGGRRLSYTLSFVLFSVALGLSAAAAELWQLIAARIFMGLGSAMVLAGVNAIILDRFEPRDRVKVIGIAGAVVGIGLSTGSLAGGWLLDTLGWRALFYTRAPISLMAAGLSWWVLEDRESSRPRDFTVDWLGAVTLFTVLASFLVVVNRSAEDGFFSPLVLATTGLLIVSVPGLIASQRRSVRPILDFGLFRRLGYGLGLG